MKLQPYQKTLLSALQNLKNLWPKKKKTAPKTLSQCHEWLSKNLSPQEILEIKVSRLADLCKLHHTMGRWIRNHWKLWEGGELKNHMESLGFIHPDDMSSVIIDSFWSKLNGQPFDIQKADKEYASFWEKSNSGEYSIVILDGKIVYAPK